MGIGRAREQITGIVGGQIVPVTIEPLLTSASTPWCGFLLETAQGVRQDAWWGWHRTHVVLFTKGSLSLPARDDTDAAGSRHKILSAPFSDGPDFEAIVVEFDPARAGALLGCKSPATTGTLAPQIAIEDAHIAALLRTMASDVAQGCPVGALYGQSLSLALASYVAGRFGVKSSEPRPVRRLSEREARRVVAYIDANLDGALNMLELSNLVQLSPRQYVRVFSNTFGTTPHRYVMNQRVGRAKELISKGRSLVEVAAVVDFASQSHLSFAFRQSTGMSPGRFRSNWVHGSNKASVASSVSSAADKASVSSCL